MGTQREAVQAERLAVADPRTSCFYARRAASLGFDASRIPVPQSAAVQQKKLAELRAMAGQVAAQQEERRDRRAVLPEPGHQQGRGTVRPGPPAPGAAGDG